MCGTPVLAFNNGGIADMIEDGVNGMLLEQSTVDALKDALKDFVMRDMKFNYRDISVKSTLRYNYPLIASRHISLYRNCMAY
jgi:glycosyltransferase involved in cell wall biosynthesis